MISFQMKSFLFIEKKYTNHKYSNKCYYFHGMLAKSSTMLYKMSIPLQKVFSFKNSLLSCSKIGVLFIGLKPNAGMPSSLRNRMSVPAGNISSVHVTPKRAHVALKHFAHGFLSSSVDVMSNIVFFYFFFQMQLIHFLSLSLSFLFFGCCLYLI